MKECVFSIPLDDLMGVRRTLVNVDVFRLEPGENRFRGVKVSNLQIFIEQLVMHILNYNTAEAQIRNHNVRHIPSTGR